MNSKKTQMLYQEAIVIAISILAISLTLYLAITYISGTKNTIEQAGPNLTYKFPATFVHGFLYTQVSKEEIITLGNIDENQIYYVKDLIYINTKESLELVEKLKSEYILNMDKLSTDNGGNMHDYYKLFSSTPYSKSNLLYIATSVDTLPEIEDSIANKNYFYYVRLEEGKYTIIYFLGDKSN